MQFPIHDHAAGLGTLDAFFIDFECCSLCFFGAVKWDKLLRPTGYVKAVEEIVDIAVVTGLGHFRQLLRCRTIVRYVTQVPYSKNRSKESRRGRIVPFVTISTKITFGTDETSRKSQQSGAKRVPPDEGDTVNNIKSLTIIFKVRDHGFRGNGLRGPKRRNKGTALLAAQRALLGYHVGKGRRGIAVIMGIPVQIGSRLRESFLIAFSMRYLRHVEETEGTYPMVDRLEVQRLQLFGDEQGVLPI